MDIKSIVIFFSNLCDKNNNIIKTDELTSDLKRQFRNVEIKTESIAVDDKAEVKKLLVKEQYDGILFIRADIFRSTPLYKKIK